MSFEGELKEAVSGQVHLDRTTRAIYSVDASIYEVVPRAVLLPRDAADVQAAVTVAWKYGVPVTARGAATSIAGNAIGPGLIIDMAQHMHQIEQLDPGGCLALCQPGVIQDQLNLAAAEHGLKFGPDTSTGNRATIGGMLGNNSSGAHSIRYGRTVDHVHSLNLVLDDGSTLKLGPLDEEAVEAKCRQSDREGKIYRRIVDIRARYADAIRAQFPTHQRRASGYNLDVLTAEGPLNLAKLIAGAEGSLGIATQIEVSLSPRPGCLGVCIVFFDDLIAGLRHAEQILSYDPCAVELIDHNIVEMGRISPSMRGRLDWLEGEPQALFVVEFDGADQDEVTQKLQAFVKGTEGHMGYGRYCTLDRQEIDNVWALRKAGLGLLMARRNYSRGVAFVEDMSIPPGHLADALGEFTSILAKHNKRGGIYGHVGAGCVHMRPFVNMHSSKELELMEELMQDLLRIAKKHSGVLSGEHGDGYLRSWQNPELFGTELYSAFKEIKATFDPENRMNPGAVIPNQGFRENLRIDNTVRPLELKTAYDWSSEGGFSLSVDMCNGNAQCRKREGLMCPSFQVTGNDYDSTRGRAQVLRQIVNGRLDASHWQGDELKRVLDLCLECKGCKKECPSQVDMAKMKSEFLYHYQKAHGTSLRNHLFAQLPLLSRLGCATAPLSNKVARSRLARSLLAKLGIAPERSLPQFTRQRFSTWWKKHAQPKGEPLVLFNDCYSEFNQPLIGQDAVKILEAMGYAIEVPPFHCCGRPLISKGFLDKAKQRASALINLLLPHARAGRRIVGLEPSCILGLRDEFPSLIPGDAAKLIAKASISLDELLAEASQAGRLTPLLLRKERVVRLHGHCHQKALVGSAPTLEVLRSLPGASVEEIPSGCCGMAGSFGYEKEHYAFSQAVGETQLFPALRQSPNDALIVASGISCRGQIEHGTQRQATHLAQAVADWLNPFA